MKRTASTYKPDMTVEGVSPQDVQDNALESRHFADNEIDPNKSATLEDKIGTPVIIQELIETGAASVLIFDGDAPFKFKILDIIVEPQGASTNGTMKVTDGTNDISDAIVAAVDKTIGRAGTIDNAYSTIEADGSLEVVCAGDVIASTIGLVTITAVKVD